MTTLCYVYVYICMNPWMHVCIIICMYIHCENKIVKITNLLVSTVARNSGNCNLIGRVGHICNYNHILILSNRCTKK